MARFIPKQFAENSTTSVVFGSHQEQGGNVGDGTISSDPATLQGGTAWPLGWKAATDNFFQIPRGEEMEGLERVLSAAIVQQFTDGITFWQANMPVTQYQTVVQYQSETDLPKLYVNITGTNTTTPPPQDAVNWLVFFDPLVSGQPTGSVIIWSTASAPAGYLLCNGGAISRTTYANLFAVIGTSYGAGDGSTTFNLPNLIDVKHLKGSSIPVKGNGITLGLTNGTQTGGLSVIYGTNTTAKAESYGKNVGYVGSTQVFTENASLGVTTDATKSGIISDISSGVSVDYIIKY